MAAWSRRPLRQDRVLRAALPADPSGVSRDRPTPRRRLRADAPSRRPGRRRARRPARRGGRAGLRQPRRHPGTALLLRPGFTRDGHDFAPDAVGRGAVAARRRAAARARRPRGPRRRRPRRDGARRRRAERRPDRRARRRRHHRHERQDDDGLPHPRLLEAAGSRPACSGPSTPIVGGAERAGCARRPRRSTSSARSPRCAPRATARGHGGLLARAGARTAPTRSTGRPRSSRTSPRTTSTSTRRWRTTSLAKRRLFESRAAAGDRQRRRPLRRAARRRLARRRTFGIDNPDAAAARHARRELDARARPSPPAASSCASPLPGRFNVLNALGAVAAARALGVDDATIAAALPRRRPRARPVRAGRRGPAASPCSSTTRTPPTRWRTSCAPRAAGRRAASSSSSARAATATAASAR